MYEELFYNKDGSLKQEVIDYFDKHFDEETKRKEDYVRNHFDNDMKVIKTYLKDHGSIDTDEAVGHTWNERKKDWDHYQVIGTKQPNTQDCHRCLSSTDIRNLVVL